jgi:3-phenylpropionate/trans-cinnamate dioxygenase ferredoxin component
VRHCLGSETEFEPAKVRVVRVGGERIGVVQYEGQFYAFEDRCTHDDGPLGGGHLDGCEIECPRHGARFDVRTGRVTAPPAYSPLETYPAEVVEGLVFVTLPE